MALFDLMSSVFKGLFDPNALAREMAQQNISPDELMGHIQKAQSLQAMPTEGAQTNPNANQGGVFDLPSQAGRNRDLNSLDNTMMDFFKMLSGNTGSNANEQQQQLGQGTEIPSGGMSKTPQGGQGQGAGSGVLQQLLSGLTAQTPPTAQAGQAGQAITSALGNLMQPAGQPQGPSTAATGMPQAAQVLQPMPQGMPGPFAPRVGMAGNNNAPPNLTNMSTFPARPEIHGGNGRANIDLTSLMNTPQNGIQPPQVRSTMTTPVPTQPNSRAGELETRGMPGDIRAAISEAATKYGQDPNTLMRMAMIESSGNPNAHNASGAAGLFQFMPSTAKQYGLSDPYDPIASADAGARLLRDNRETLTAQLGREPTPGELYLAHQQGSGGAAKLLSNPDAKAADMVGEKAVVSNGGSAGMTSRQFSDLWINKMNNFGDPPAGSQDSSKPVNPGDSKIPTPTDRPLDNTPTAPTTGPASTSAAAGKNPFSFMDALTGDKNGSGDQMEMNLPRPPPPVAPSPGRYDVNPQAMQLMLAMLGPMAGGAQIPSIAQLMGAR